MNKALQIEKRLFLSGIKSGLSLTCATEYVDICAAEAAHKSAASDCKIGLVRKEIMTGARYVITSVALVCGPPDSIRHARAVIDSQGCDYK